MYQTLTKSGTQTFNNAQESINNFQGEIKQSPKFEQIKKEEIRS